MEHAERLLAAVEGEAHRQARPTSGRRADGHLDHGREPQRAEGDGGGGIDTELGPSLDQTGVIDGDARGHRGAGERRQPVDGGSQPRPLGHRAVGGDGDARRHLDRSGELQLQLVASPTEREPGGQARLQQRHHRVERAVQRCDQTLRQFADGVAHQEGDLVLVELARGAQRDRIAERGQRRADVVAEVAGFDPGDGVEHERQRVGGERLRGAPERGQAGAVRQEREVDAAAGQHQSGGHARRRHVEDGPARGRQR